MKDFKRLITLIQPYKVRILFFFVFSNLMVFFNALSFVMSGPFFQMLFEPEEFKVEAPASVTDLDSFIQYCQYELGIFIEEEGQAKALAMICFFIITVFFLKNLFRYLAAFTIIPVRYGAARHLRNRLFDKVLELPLPYFADERKGDLIVKMTNDVEEFRISALQMLESLLRDPFAIVITFGIMIFISAKLTLISILMVVLIFFVIGRISNTLKKRSKKAQAKMSDMTSTVEETLSGLRIIKGFNALNYQRKKFQQENFDHQYILTRIWWRIATASPLSEFFGASVVCILLMIGSGFVANGEFSAGGLISFIAIFWSMITPLKSLSQALFNTKKGFGAADRVYELLHSTSSIQSNPNAQAISTIEKGIDYQHLSFAYENNRQVLKNISFHLPKGKILALVGASGAGKSTLVDLLPRFYDVNDGEILIDGKNIKDVKLSDLRGLMGIVSQDAVLFHDTIYNNIAFGLEGVTRSQIEEAAKIANAHDFILNTENGYETVIGDRGLKLSGGQRQRLTIARAILRNPPILILDEATSALDSESEKLVQDALYKLMQNRTSIVIAHRLSTIQHADEIIVLQEGEIVEKGNHEELLAKNGVYKKLVELQSL